TERAPHLGPERPRVYSDLSPEEKDRYNADIRVTNILLQGLPKNIYTLINHYTDAKDIWDIVKMLLEGSELTKEDQESQLVDRIEVRGPIYGVKVQLGMGEFRTELRMNSDYFKEKMLLMQAQENGVALDEEQLLCRKMVNSGRDTVHLVCVIHTNDEPAQDLALNVDNVFQTDDCDAFDSDVDEAPTVQTMFVANFSSTDPVCDEAGPSYDSDILSEVHDHDHSQDAVYPVCDEAGPSYDSDILSEVHDHDHSQDAVCEPHDEHEMHDNVQLNHVIDTHADYTSNSNMILYDQYVKDNVMPVVETSLTAKLATYKEQVKLYERRARELLSHIHTTEAIDPEQIFWSQDLIKMKTAALKEQNTASRPIKALTVYPPNTPATLVPREHFEGIQKALTKEIKEMKYVFKELEAEVAQNAVDRKHDEIKRKNLLVVNDNLITECLSKEVFYVATNSELNVSRFTKMHVANTTVEAHYLELEAELSNLRDKSHDDNHDELLNCFSNLEVHHLNLQLKYQNLKDSFKNNPPTPDKDTPDFDLVFVIGKMQAFLQGKENIIKKLQKQVSHLQKTRSEADRTLDFRALDSQTTQLTTKVTALQAQNDLFRAENDKIKQHYKELYDSIKITCAKYIEQVTALTNANVNLKAQIMNNVNSVSKDQVTTMVLAPGKYAIDVEPIPFRRRNNKKAHLDYLKHLKESVETIRDIVEEGKVNMRLTLVRMTLTNEIKKHAPAPLVRKKQVTFTEQCDKSNSNTHEHVAKLNTQKTNVPVPPYTGLNRFTDASGSQPRSNIKKNRISPAKGVNKMQVEEQPRTNKSHLRTTNRVDSSSRSKSCSKHMTGDRSRLMNFVKKFIGTVRFGNDHFGVIMGYGDYMIGDSVIYRKALAGLICTLSRLRHDEVLSNLLLSKASKNKSWLWHRQAVATACYTQNRSFIHTRHNKTPYELVHNKKPDLTFFKVFGALCYPTNDSEDLERLQPTADIGIFICTKQESDTIPVNSAGTPSSTSIDQDAPSPNNLVAPVENNPFINVFALEPISDASSSGD
nr:integrase, catalytic region, zinc finger, CCHC-type, peptidase aspartic, catalytic [Tanacetum cinerariifolium]